MSTKSEGKGLRPPSAAIRLLRWFCAPHLLDEIEGDLSEQYMKRLRKHTPLLAKVLFWKDMVFFIRPYVFRHDPSRSPWVSGAHMWSSYVRTSLRRIRRQRGYSGITIAGLSLGLACSLIAILFVRVEYSYDRFHEHADRIYRVLDAVRDSEDRSVPSLDEFKAWGSAPIGPALVSDFPEVLEAVRFSGRHTILLAYEDRVFQEERYFAADSNVFDVFTFPLLRGDPARALSQPNTIVLAESAARRYFGGEDAMGKTMLLFNQLPVTVTGVMQEVPSTSHLDFDILFSFATIENAWPEFRFTDWGYRDFFTYILLADGQSIESLQAKMPDFVQRHVGDRLGSYHVAFQPIREAYLSPIRNFLPGPVGRRSDSIIYSAIAVFILLIASVNYMNLSTARALERAREIGVRRVVGAQRRHIMLQIFVEAIVYSVIAVVNAVILVLLSLPAFRFLTGKALDTAALSDPVVVGLGLTLAVVVGLIAGCYPMVVFSSLRPTAVLKGSGMSTRSGLTFRRGLVVFQFAITVAMIAGTIVVFSQVTYMRNHRLGFDEDHMLMIDFGEDPNVIAQLSTVRSAFETHPAVRSVSITRNVPGSFYTQEGTGFERADGQWKEAIYNTFQVDEEFIPQFGLEMVAGRPYDREHPSDSTRALVINEALARELGYADPNGAIGKRFAEWVREGEIIGVVRDFNYESLQRRVEPLTLSLRPTWARYVVLKLQTDYLNQTVSEIEQIWKKTLPSRPFLFNFLDDSFDEQYRRDVRFGQTAGILAGIAIFIACLGLFGLTASVATTRTKEIGIRKALGASAGNIVAGLSREFIGLVSIGVLFAVPLSYPLLESWLRGFAFHTKLGAGTFILSGFLALLIAALTVVHQTAKAANTKPVDALRLE